MAEVIQCKSRRKMDYNQTIAVIEQLFHFMEGICIFSTTPHGVYIFFWRYFAQ